MEEREADFIGAVKAHQGTMYRVALSMLHRSADAEDAVSAAVEATWRHLATLRAPEMLRAYLIRCTINACHTALRRRKREEAVEAVEAYLPPMEGETPLWMLLGDLPEWFRLPLVLRFSEGLPEKDIARMLRWPRGTVSSRIHRGLRMLREDMGKEESGDE